MMMKNNYFTLFGIIFLQLCFHLDVFAKEAPAIHLTQSAKAVWQREQVMVTIDVLTDDPFARLEFPPFKQNGIDIIPFEQTRREEGKQTRLLMKWALFPFVAGTYDVELPPITYRPNGGRKVKYPPLALTLHVKKLPVYVPPTMPVGRILLKKKNNTNNGLLSPHHLQSMQIKVTGIAVAKQTMPPISRQLKSNNFLSFFPIKIKKQLQLKPDHIINQAIYTIPFRTNKNGFIHFPTINVQFFEPKKGRLEMVTLTPPLLLSLDKWIIWLLFFMAIVISAYLIINGYKILITVIRHRKQRKQAIHVLNYASSYDEIRQALIQFSAAHEWKQNLTLSEFVVLWMEKYGTSTALPTLIEELQALQFSNNKHDEFTLISQQLAKVIQ